mmetsp:Transcript_6902/g.14798  ORF Transcript_6902/g.14798 Transcript_6902/m.14798 type:complete len:176 (+) Transcript_6902:1291-1818(+)
MLQQDRLICMVQSCGSTRVLQDPLLLVHVTSTAAPFRPPNKRGAANRRTGARRNRMLLHRNLLQWSKSIQVVDGCKPVFDSSPVQLCAGDVIAVAPSVIGVRWCPPGCRCGNVVGTMGVHRSLCFSLLGGVCLCTVLCSFSDCALQHTRTHCALGLAVGGAMSVPVGVFGLAPAR